MQINTIQYTPKQNGFTGKINQKSISDFAQETFNLSKESMINLDDYSNYFIPTRYKVKMDAKELKQLFNINENANSSYFLDSCHQYFKTGYRLPDSDYPCADDE